HVHGVQSLRNVVLALVRSDIPEVSRRIFHATRALAILLIPGLINGRSARSQSLLINRIAIRNVEMDGMGIRGSPELAPRNAPAHHQHRVADAHLAVQPARS